MTGTRQVVLIGPVCVGKSTVLPLVAARLGRPHVDLDDVAEPYYEEVGHGRDRLHEIGAARGDLGAYLWWQEAHPHAVRRVLEDHPGAVIALGAGHTTYADASRFEEVRQLLEPHDVVLLLPGPDHAASLTLLRDRAMRLNGMDWIMDGVDVLEQWVTGDQNRALATVTVHTGDRSPEAIAAEIVTALGRRPAPDDAATTPDDPRSMPRTPEGLRAAWETIEDAWEATIQRARRLPEAALHERVDDEWSFVETQRHLLFATDVWIRRSVVDDPKAWHRLGMPPDMRTGRPDDNGVFAKWGIDITATPSLDEVVEARHEYQRLVRDVIEQATAETLNLPAPHNPPWIPDEVPVSMAARLDVVVREEWEHHGFATRDLTILEANRASSG